MKSRLFDLLPDDTGYPGHGDDSTLGEQKSHIDEWRNSAMSHIDTLTGMGTRGRFGFWFPLMLLGFLTLGSAAFAQGGWWVDARYTSFPGNDYPVTTTLYGLEMSRAAERQLHTLSPGAVYAATVWSFTSNPEYWIVGVTLVFLAAIAWYAHGSGRVRAFALATVCGSVAIVAFPCMMWIIDETPDLAPTIAGSLLAIGLCAAAWVYFQLGRGRSALTAISVVTLAVGVTGLLATWTSYRAEELLVTGGLLVLAWWERSLLLAALTAVLLLIGAVPLPTIIEFILVTGLLFTCSFVALARRSGGQAVAVTRT
ncbi:Integral membrane protein [Kibdelosporangium persicum]|uniref:DUF2029 domain-containing protein n=1 Tax=Kibdelosporangium persicum TaxID=2698649 RepID=A0ABX2F377_9PSEU|nr:hypothetical protein [Kibdelosporangium persicum]